MKLRVVRNFPHPRRTLGTLAVDLADGRGMLPFGFTCEDWDDGKDGHVYHEDDWGRLCIPAGTYAIEWAWSPAHDRNVPRLKGVPGRRNIEIHAGNTEIDTKGCVLVGLRVYPPYRIEKSRLAVEWLYPRIEAACASPAGCTIEITRALGFAPVPRDPTLPRQA